MEYLQMMLPAVVAVGLVIAFATVLCYWVKLCE